MNANKEIAVDQENLPERVSQRAVVAPPVDVYENNEELLVVADMPGVSKESINLRFDKNELHFEGTIGTVNSELKPVFREFSEADYHRAFQVMPGIDVDNIKADISNGVLSIRLPKSKALKPRQIKVKAK